MKAAIIRFLRTAVAVGIPIIIQQISQSTDPKILGLAPVLMGIGKYLDRKSVV